MRKGRHTAKVYFFLTLAPCLWGGNFIAGQYIGDDLNGATANLLRWLVAILAMVPFLAQAVLRDWYAVVRAVPYLFGLGLLGVAGFNTVLYEGLKLVSVSIAAVAFACTPVLIALFSSVIDRRLPARSLVIGVFLSFGGVTYANAGALQGGADPLGVALVGLASLLWAIYCVALRWKPQDVSTEAGFLVQTALGSCMLVPISWAGSTQSSDGIAQMTVLEPQAARQMFRFYVHRHQTHSPTSQAIFSVVGALIGSQVHRPGPSEVRTLYAARFACATPRRSPVRPRRPRQSDLARRSDWARRENSA
jgi:drug/metabolite transporter (DMT)-like permease